MKIAIVLFTTTLLLASCSFSNNWQGVYYPDGCLVCEDKYIFSPIFSNYDECQRWAINIYNNRNNTNDQYECGKNYKFKDGLQICDETR